MASIIKMFGSRHLTFKKWVGWQKIIDRPSNSVEFASTILFYLHSGLKSIFPVIFCSKTGLPVWRQVSDTIPLVSLCMSGNQYNKNGGGGTPTRQRVSVFQIK